MILVIDNYDSFVHNLARYIRCLGYQTQIYRNDAITLKAIAAMAPSHIVLSPGPCSPSEAGMCLPIIKAFAGSIPILGICLGHQAIGQALGARIVRAKQARHGKSITIKHQHQGLFSGLPQPIHVALYHSLVIDCKSLPTQLTVDAYSPEGDIMAIHDASQQLYGLQFHPESILTSHGPQIIQNFLDVRIKKPAPDQQNIDQALPCIWQD